MQKTLTKTLNASLLAGIIALPATLMAQPSAHYPPGLEGIKAATLPPPGLYLRDYNYFYFSDRLNDSNGDEISAADPEVFVYANAPRLLWITDLKLLGGYIGVDALVPLQYSSLEIFGFDDDAFNVGDVFGEVTWSWHFNKLDAAIGYGIWAPTGEDSTDFPNTEAGLGFWTHMITAGATLYLDGDKRWSLSALNRYEISTEKDDTDSTVGDVWTIEGGLGYGLSKTMDLGVVAYYQNQFETGEGTYPTVGRDWVVAAGPEISVFYPKSTFGWSLRYLYEIESESRLQGHTATLTLTKRF